MSSTICIGGTDPSPLYLYRSSSLWYTCFGSMSMVVVQNNEPHTVPCIMMFNMFTLSVIPCAVLTASCALSLSLKRSVSLSFLSPASYKSLMHSYVHNASKKCLRCMYTGQLLLQILFLSSWISHFFFYINVFQGRCNNVWYICYH